MAAILSIALNPTIDMSSEAEQVVPTRKIRTCNEKHHPGGGGVNVARVINMLGGAVELIFTSGGVTGILLEQSLDCTGIECRKIKIEQSTRLAHMIYEQQTGLEYRFVPVGPEVSQQELNLVLEQVEEFEGDYIIVSGSLPLSVPYDTYALIADIADRKNIRFIIDSSGEGLKCALAKSPVFLIKPNHRELEKLTGKRLDNNEAKEAALELVRNGSARNVVVSMGAEGAFLANEEGGLFIPASPVNVRSAVGAGDSFVGAMAFSLASGHAIQDAFRFGVAAGAAAVMTDGTELCKREDVLKLYGDILSKA
ncbi:1-phosphofructokinase family hexose kinase [Motiliproteus sp. MSK22-1]|uniref:1-phosphofructokinase family hexose kinase n=1 Tax=Motiliproteus sp. MSK22-1 TaxID=1897630 RepID=UPI0009763BB2|nr:1-phosphofructokinase family hexose kinase [Motiliproteus sp. MSK22-1]OMH32782.1 1-phosphofructokinase [Motiliproteus sp. MSK22-1]